MKALEVSRRTAVEDAERRDADAEQLKKVMRASRVSAWKDAVRRAADVKDTENEQLQQALAMSLEEQSIDQQLQQALAMSLEEQSIDQQLQQALAMSPDVSGQFVSPNCMDTVTFDQRSAAMSDEIDTRVCQFCEQIIEAITNADPTEARTFLLSKLDDVNADLSEMGPETDIDDIERHVLEHIRNAFLVFIDDFLSDRIPHSSPSNPAAYAADSVEDGPPIAPTAGSIDRAYPPSYASWSQDRIRWTVC